MAHFFKRLVLHICSYHFGYQVLIFYGNSVKNRSYFLWYDYSRNGAADILLSRSSLYDVTSDTFRDTRARLSFGDCAYADRNMPCFWKKDQADFRFIWGSIAADILFLLHPVRIHFDFKLYALWGMGECC